MTADELRKLFLSINWLSQPIDDEWVRNHPEVSEATQLILKTLMMPVSNPIFKGG